MLDKMAIRSGWKQEFGKLPGAQGMTEVIALRFCAAVLFKKNKLLASFHSFPHDPHIQAPAHVDDGANHAGIVGIRGDIPDERAIDLQGVDWKPPHVTQTRITRSKIIERDLYPKYFESVEDHRGRLGVLHQEGLGEFQLEASRIETGLGQNRLHARHEFLGAQFHCRNFDSQPEQRPALWVPGFGLSARLPQHPLTDRYDQAGFFGYRYESRGGHDSEGRVSPTNQSLDAGDGAGRHAPDGLVIQFELVPRDRMPQPALYGLAL